VFLGSAAYVGKWMSDTASFVGIHQEALGLMPVAYFTVCLIIKLKTEENHRAVEAFLDPVRE
jgi:menaquinone-dependent protoporphyrinogen IX oxidase